MKKKAIVLCLLIVLAVISGCEKPSLESVPQELDHVNSTYMFGMNMECAETTDEYDYYLNKATWDVYFEVKNKEGRVIDTETYYKPCDFEKLGKNILEVSFGVDRTNEYKYYDVENSRISKKYRKKLDVLPDKELIAYTDNAKLVIQSIYSDNEVYKEFEIVNDGHVVYKGEFINDTQFKLEYRNSQNEPLSIIVDF